jgi:hypothetical protein
VGRKREEAQLQLELVCQLSKAAVSNNQFFSCENPMNSLAWREPPLRHLMEPPFRKVRMDQRCSYFSTHAHTCARQIRRIIANRPGACLLQDAESAGQRHPRCQFGLKGPSGKLLMKPTEVVSNHEGILQNVHRLCSHDHEHETIQGNVTRMSENYPWALGCAIADAVMGTTTEPHEIPTEEDDIMGVCGEITYRLDQARILGNLRCLDIN